MSMWFLLVLHQLIIMAENRIVPDKYEPITPMRVRDDFEAQTTSKRIPIDYDSDERNEVVEENEQKVNNNHTRIVPDKYEPITPMRVRDDFEAQTTSKRIPIDYDSDERNEVVEENEQKVNNNHTPCTVVVMSNVQSPNMHTLMRRYRYDKNGVLIPSSVKYYMKRLEANSPSYVALSDQAFSPQGGFIRFYKEVPPIPRIW